MNETPASGSAVVESQTFNEGKFGGSEPQEAVKPPVPSPAEDLRHIQGLLAGGIFPGNMAPQVVKSWNLLEHMAQQIEKEANVSK